MKMWIENIVMFKDNNILSQFFYINKLDLCLETEKFGHMIDIVMSWFLRVSLWIQLDCLICALLLFAWE